MTPLTNEQIVANLRRTLTAILGYLVGRCGHSEYCAECAICDAIHSATIALEDSQPDPGDSGGWTDDEHSFGNW